MIRVSRFFLIVCLGGMIVGQARANFIIKGVNALKSALEQGIKATNNTLNNDVSCKAGVFFVTLYVTGGLFLIAKKTDFFYRVGRAQENAVRFACNKFFSNRKRAVDPNWCGNKHHNLVKLQSIVSDIPEVIIPEFIGISSQRIEVFLRKHEPSIFDDYEYVTFMLDTSNGVPISFKEKIKNKLFFKKYSGESLEVIIARIERNIERCFDYYSFEFNKQEKELFKKMEKQNQFCMVRSTGVEDSQTVANAGGNISVSYVQPVTKKIKKAMGQVVASYFGLQSLKNRLQAGERLSATPLCIPVLIQTLVDESSGGTGQAAIPVSGVAFTTKQSLSNSHFTVTEINASFGHGEGIVANRVAADRYYITSSRAHQGQIAIYPVIAYKTHRLIPNQHGTLVPCKNNNALVSCLSEEQLTRLYAVLKKIELAYGQPMDVEFVVCGSVIYIVQARPAMRCTQEPSYCICSTMTQNILSPYLSGNTIVSAGSQVLVITDPKEVVVARTLDEAEQYATARTKIVFIQSWASPLSHAAVNFTAHAVACLQMQDVAQLQQVLSQITEQTPLVVDIQQKVICIYDLQKGPIQSHIAKGWLEHPIDRMLSVQTESPSILSAQLNPLPIDGTLIKLLEQLKQANTKDSRLTALDALYKRIESFEMLIESRMHHAALVCSEKIKQAYAIFKNMCNSVIAELRASIQQNADQFEILFYEKMIEALLFQAQDAQQISDAYTAAYFLNDLFKNQMLLNALKKPNNTIALSVLQYISACPNKELSVAYQDWLQALQAYVGTDPIEYTTDREHLVNILYQLNECEALPIWFATEFYEAIHSAEYKTPHGARLVLAQLVQPYNQTEQFYIEQLLKINSSIKRIQNQKKQTFNSSAEVMSVWHEIKHELIVPLTEPSFMTRLASVPLCVRLNAYGIMHELIDVIDTTIKMTKTSSALSWQERIHLFKEMLPDFLHVCKTWLKQVMPEDALIYHHKWDRSAYLDRLETLCKNILYTSNDPSMFKRSNTFAVNAAVLGSSTAFERHYPQTAEDIFMLIHQNSLIALAGATTGAFTQKALYEQMYLPQSIIDIMTYLQSPECIQQLTSGRASAPVLIGISYTTDLIELKYNMSLNNDSSTFQIIYNQSTQTCSMSVQFLGEARNRWEQIALLADLSPMLSGLELIDSVMLDEQAGIVSFSWSLQTATHLPLVVLYLSEMGRLSFERDLTANRLKRLVRTTNAVKQTIIGALQYYKQIHSKNSIIEKLLQQAELL